MPKRKGDSTRNGGREKAAPMIPAGPGAFVSVLKAGNTFVLCPERTLPVGRVSHSRSNMRAAYNLGRELATSELPRIQAFLKP